MEPDVVALHDQVQADAKQKARVVGAYFLSLIAEGVPEYEAMRLSLAFQRRFIFPDDTTEPGDADED